jgi:hypothetical protein
LREELAVKVSVGRPLNPVVWRYEAATIRLRPFLCTIIAGELQALEHERLLWCAPADFHQLPWAAADVPILREIAAIRSERSGGLTSDTDALPSPLTHEL